MRDNLNERLQNIFSRFIKDEDEIDAIIRGEPILEATSIDSLTMVRLIVEIEKEFKVRFDIEALEQIFENIESILTYIENNFVKKI